MLFLKLIRKLSFRIDETAQNSLSNYHSGMFLIPANTSPPWLAKILWGNTPGNLHQSHTYSINYRKSHGRLIVCMEGENICVLHILTFSYEEGENISGSKPVGQRVSQCVSGDPWCLVCTILPEGPWNVMEMVQQNEARRIPDNCCTIMRKMFCSPQRQSAVNLT